jgi:hypothetical protein
MNCKGFRDNLVAYLRGELPKPESDEMNAHVSACRRCRNEHRKTARAMDILVESEQAPVIRIVHTYILEAIKRDASDIHFEARLWGLSVRCRIDGVIVDLNEIVHETNIADPAIRALLDTMDWDLGHAVVNRLRIMADVDITESDIPQTGSIRIRWENRDYTLSGSFVPASGGVDAVFRIIARGAPITTEEMGMSEEVRAGVERMLDQPMGLILIGGPAGSGKTTVVMSLAQRQAAPSHKVVTIEDPVFSKMENVTQDLRGLPRGVHALAAGAEVALPRSVQRQARTRRGLRKVSQHGLPRANSHIRGPADEPGACGSSSGRRGPGPVPVTSARGHVADAGRRRPAQGARWGLNRGGSVPGDPSAALNPASFDLSRRARYNPTDRPRRAFATVPS